MLLGVGVSNVFDGSRDLGGGFVLRGVPSRPPVGLLSELEALRYLQVRPARALSYARAPRARMPHALICRVGTCAARARVRARYAR